MTTDVNDTIERYVISGVGPYAFSFRIFNATDLTLAAISAATPGVASALTYLTHYTVSGTDILTGGSVTLVAGAAATYAGYTLDIRSNTPEKQPTSIRNQSRFLPESNEDALDNLSRQIQDINRRVDASIHLPDTEIISCQVEPASSRKGKYLFWDTVTGAISSALALTGTVLTQLIFDTYFSASTAVLSWLRVKYDITPAETAASVTPTNYYIAPGDVRGSVLRYGAVCDGVTDDSAAIQRALNCKGLVTLPPGKGCLINTGLTMDVATTTLDMQGGALNYQQTSGSALTIDSSQGAENEGRNGVRNGIIYGKLPVVGTPVGISFVASGVNPVANVNIEHVTSSFFYSSFYISTNAFCINFSGCMASNSTIVANVVASSEKNSFNHCFFGNCTIIFSSAASTQIVAVNCSLDYSNRIADITSGYAFFDNCYVENNLDTGPWFVTGTSEQAQIRFRGGVIVSGGVKTQPIASAGAGSVIRFENVMLYSNNDVVGGNFLGSGAGSTYAKDCSIVGFSQNSQCWVGGSPAQNLCDNGFFTANLTGWTLASTGGALIPAFNGGAGSAGQGAMQFHTDIAGQTSTATWTVPAQPGQVCGVSLEIKAANVAAKFQFVLQAIGQSGAVIATSDILNGKNQFGFGTNFVDTAYHSYRNAFSRLPAGTTSVKLLLTADYAGAFIVLVDNVVICTY